MGLGCSSSLLFLPPVFCSTGSGCREGLGMERSWQGVPGAAGEEVEELDDVTSCGGAAAGDGDEASPPTGGSGGTWGWLLLCPLTSQWLLVPIPHLHEVSAVTPHHSLKELPRLTGLCPLSLHSWCLPWWSTEGREPEAVTCSAPRMLWPSPNSSSKA